MRDLIQLIEQAQSSGDKILRDAFLYLPPKGDPDTFAQCGSCGMFIPEAQRCWLFGKDDEVIADASCGLYIQGKPNNDQEPQNKVTPEQAGYNLGQVRCENCRWGDDGTCKLYEQLNQQLPEIFDLDTKINSNGCCNAWQG